MRNTLFIGSFATLVFLGFAAVFIIKIASELPILLISLIVLVWLNGVVLSAVVAYYSGAAIIDSFAERKRNKSK